MLNKPSKYVCILIVHYYYDICLLKVIINGSNTIHLFIKRK